MKRRTRVRRRLRRAFERQELVRIRRNSGDLIEGYVVSSVDDGPWLLVAALDPGSWLDGWIVVRRRDVRRVRPGRSPTFIRRALELHGEWPPAPVPGLDLSSTRALLESAGRCFPLLVLEEYDAPDLAFVGALVGARKKAFGLLEITPRATWEQQPSRWKFRKVRRIDLGGRYEQALHDVGGPPPVRSARTDGAEVLDPPVG